MLRKAVYAAVLVAVGSMGMFAQAPAAPPAGQAPTGAVVSVADDSTFQIDTEVKENYLEQLSVGDEVEFTSPSARGATFTGTIKSIAPVAAAAPTEDGQPGPAQGAGRGISHRSRVRGERLGHEGALPDVRSRTM